MFIETIGEFLPFWAPWIAVIVLAATLLSLALVRKIYPTKQWWLLMVRILGALAVRSESPKYGHSPICGVAYAH